MFQIKLKLKLNLEKTDLDRGVVYVYNISKNWNNCNVTLVMIMIIIKVVGNFHSNWLGDLKLSQELHDFKISHSALLTRDDTSTFFLSENVIKKESVMCLQSLSNLVRKFELQNQSRNSEFAFEDTFVKTCNHLRRIS